MTCKGEQPKLWLPSGYFTYLQPQQPHPPTRLRLLTVVTARPSHSLLGTAHLLFLFFVQGFFGGEWDDGWAGVGQGEECENNGRPEPQIMTGLLLQ